MSGNDNIAFTSRKVAASTTLTANDYLICVEAPGANVVLTLPAVASVPAGRPYYVVRDTTATYTVTLTPQSAEKIDSGSNGVGVAVGAAATAGGCQIISDGTQWFRIAVH